MRAARLLIAEEEALLRDALTAALDAEDGFEVVAEVGHGLLVVDAVERCEPDLVLLGSTLPPGNWKEVCAELTSWSDAPKVVVREPEADEDTLRTAMEAGATGYVSGDMDLPAVLDALRSVVGGCTFVPPVMLGPLLAALMRRNRDDDRVLHAFLTLTRREREVLELLVEGHGPEAVSSALGIAPQTARTHIQNIIEKLGVHSRLEVVALAVTHGILDRLPRANVPQFP